MREEESVARYLSPLVKQDLAKLDADGDSRRLALKSLKQFIEQLDATSMPKFLSQIAESRESGGSRAYAISLYEEVARVHRKLIKPHLPRVMSSVIRALAASGSSPQLQQACAKVTAAMARYTIDPAMSIENAEEIIQTVCDPLAEALTGKLEPVTAGAAACIHALIETENWKYASEETVHAVCQRVTVALSEKSTRTVFHLQLVSALTAMNPDTLSLYGASLLRIAAEILRTTVDSWQQRKAAAKLLQGVLIILDKETLETEVDLAIHTLESCRLDKMPHVRLAVSEALYAAKTLASGDSSQTCSVLSRPLLRSISTSMEFSSSPWTKRDVEQSRKSWSKGDMDRSQSPWTKEGLSSSPVQKRIVSPTSQESNQLSFSPASTSTTESMHIRHPVRRSNSRKLKRTPLYPARSLGFAPSSRCSSPGTLSLSGSISDDCEFTAQQFFVVDAKENMPVRITNANGALSSEEAEEVQVPAKANLRMTVPFTNTLIPSLPLDKFADENHTPKPKDHDFTEKLVDRSVPHVGKDAPDCMVPRHVMSPMVSAILDELTETASNILAEDDAVLALLDNQIEKSRTVKPNYRKGALPRLRLGFDTDCPDRYAADNANRSFERPTMQQNENRPVVRNANECMEGCAEVESRGVNLAGTDSMDHSAPECDEGSDPKSLKGSGPHEPVSNLKHHRSALTHLDFSPTSTHDALPFATPKRVMRALQSLNSAIPDSRRVSVNEDVAVCQHDATVLDVDVEASSEAGWSVRDNPIASDESFGADTSDEEELEDRLKFPSKGAQLQSIPLSDSCDIHISSPVEKARPLLQNTSESYFTPMQPLSCVKCDITCSASSEGRFFSPYVEDGGGASIFCDAVEMSGGLRCDCLAICEDFVTTTLEFADKDCCRRLDFVDRDPQSLWDSRFMLVRLVSRNWKNLCWYGEIILGGTLCVVLTLPLAMVLANTLNSTPEHLVPT